MKVLALALSVFSITVGQGWIGQRRVHPANGDVPDGAPSIAVDATSRPWVVWDTRDSARLGDTTQVFAVWRGDSWGSARGIGLNLPGVERRLNSSIAFDTLGQAWLVWDNVNEGNTDDIGSSFWADSCWMPEVQVNLSDSTERDFAPQVACGGGRVWCVWYGGPTDMTPYSVFASRWDPTEQCWEPEMQVSPLRPEQWQWWCDVAVDSEGIPHVVWVAVPACSVYHSFYEHDQWQGPFPVNDSMVRAATWADPHIVIDNTGMMHACYTGVATGNTRRDIFYTRNDGTGWTPSVRVSQDTLHNCNEWYSDIAAERPDNVWVAWDRQNEGPDRFRMYASHFNESEWSPEERLDNDSVDYDCCPAVYLDHQGWPWAVWTGLSESGQVDVFYNRFLSTGIHEAGEDPTCRNTYLRLASCHSLVPVEIGFVLDAPTSMRLEVFDLTGRRVATLAQGVKPAGVHTVLWDGDAPAGVYLCRLSAGRSKESRMMILTGR